MPGIDTGPMMKSSSDKRGKKSLFGKKRDESDSDEGKGKKKGLAMILARLSKKK